MESLRNVAACIGITGSFRVLRNFFGYSSTPGTLSVLTQVRRLQGKHVHMNIIRVGSDLFTAADERKIDSAVQFTRDTYATRNLGVGFLDHRFITVAQANGREFITDGDEAEELTNEWTVPNSALDVFFVRTIGDAGGWSRVDGPCDKDAKGMDGSVIDMSNNTAFVGIALAHEAGHYLGLSHVNSPSGNLMLPNGGTTLTSSQGSKIRSHCFVKSSC